MIIINNKRRVIPDIQVTCKVKELKYSPQAKCWYRQMNNKLALFQSNEWMSEPSITLCEICKTALMEKSKWAVNWIAKNCQVMIKKAMKIPKMGPKFQI